MFLDFAKSGGGSPISLAEGYSASEVCGSFSFRVGNINIPSPLMGEGAGGGEGLKFRRQEPIGRYIVDFVCHERGIVIEVDGGRHSIYKDRDRERDIWLNRQGYEVLRFWNNEVLTNSPDSSHQGRGKM